VQVFDQKKFKKKDQGFLGVINIRVGDVMPDLTPDASGMSCADGDLTVAYRSALLAAMLTRLQTKCSLGT
jgi:hypothetical protein